jgi:hypothetical protein
MKMNIGGPQTELTRKFVEGKDDAARKWSSYMSQLLHGKGQIRDAVDFGACMLVPASQPR